MGAQERDTAAALRGLLRSGLQDASRILPGLLPGVASGESALLLYAVLRSLRDKILVNQAFQTLAAAGRLGRTLALQFIQARVLPLPQIAALIQAMPQRDALALQNEMLLECPAADKQLMAWLRTVLPATGRLDPREALLFLKALRAEETPLARPLREALLGSGLAEALPRALAGTPGPATAEAVLTAVEALQSPALHAEALAYALRTAGSEGPSRLGPLLAAGPDIPPREGALDAELRRVALRPDAPALLLAAARMEPEALGRALAALHAEGGPAGTAALALAPLLPRAGFEALADRLPDQAQAQVLALVFTSLARREPDMLRRAAKAMAAPLGQEALEALSALLASRPAARREPEPFAPGQPATATARKAPVAEALKDAPPLVKDEDFSRASLAGETLEGITFNGTDFSNGRFAQTAFRRLRFSSARLFGSVFENCVFSGCAFQGSDLAEADFSGCRFEGCTFELCDLAGVRLHSCTLTGCSLSECCLSRIRLTKSRLVQASLRACALDGLFMHESALSGSALLRTDLSGVQMEKSVVRDTECAACTLASACLSGCELMGLELARTALPGLALVGGHTDNPDLALAELAHRARTLSEAPATPLAPALAAGPGADFVRACVQGFLRVDEARRSLAAMRGRNQRRLALAQERLGEAQGAFLRLLPLLLATDVFEQARKITGAPACSVDDRSLAASLAGPGRALLERFFPGLAPGAQPAPEIDIKAVYSIGSMGTVAQKPSSDLDCWVCYGLLPAAGEHARAGLSAKLSALEAWAGEQLGLELHFFPMPMADVRANIFGISDKESSGTAQAALLKEEFYRTALKLAGRDLAWWAAPPGADQPTLAALLAELAALSPRTAAELEDLGQPAAIPEEEYFGACLWQMVKALHSPYKSVMKLALLEKYAGRGRTMRLLCDRIKEAAQRGRVRLEELDPYLSLFASVRLHYEALGDATSLGLLGECLLLKTEADPEDLPPGLANLPEGNGTFAQSLRLGGLVSQFMIAAYRRIQEGIRADKTSARISPEDMTRLGRRIAANFSQQEHKVGVVPFLSEALAFTELFFYAEKAPGKRTIWAAKGKEKNSGKATVESLEPIRRDPDVARLLAWILINGIYDPKLTVQAEKSLAPIAVMDLQSLLADMAFFFPRAETLDPDMDQYLEDERVTRAYIILNLPVPPEKNKILTLSVVYATTWGEVFCQSFENPPQAFQTAPMTFLRENLAKPVKGMPECKVFLPKKSACPRVKIL